MKKNDKLSLIEAYKKTTYKVLYNSNEINIKVDIFNQDLESLLETHNSEKWVFITAYNPYSEELSVEKNTKRLNLLKKDLKEYIFFDGIGIPDEGSWKPEKSFLVLDINENKTLALCKKYKQNAIIQGIKGGKPELIFFNTL